MYTFVQALATEVWDEIRETKPDFANPRPVRTMVRALVEAKWSIDRVGTDVEPGLVVAFERKDDADYFLTAHGRKEEPRADLVYVTEGSVVAFSNASDAEYWVRKGRARSLTEAEAYALAHQAQMAAATEAAQAGTEEDDMQKVKLDNKAGAPAPETKQDAADPKPAPAKGKKTK